MGGHRRPSRARSTFVALVLGLLAGASGCAWFNPAGALLAKGKKLEAKGKFAEAATAYETVIAKYPNHPETGEAHFRAAVAEETQARYPEALGLYESFFKAYPDRQEANDALSHAASILEERQGNWQKAAAYLQELRARTTGTPEAPKVLFRLAKLLEHSGTPYTDALAMYGLVCKDCAAAPEAVYAWLAAARIHESMKNWTEAKRCYQAALGKLGAAAEAAQIRAQYQAVQLQEALGVYFSGSLEGGVALADEALKDGGLSPEVKLGLDDLEKRYRSATRFWKKSAAATTVEDDQPLKELDEARFVARARTGEVGDVPAGWAVTFDARKKRLTVKEAPPEGKKGRKKTPWSFSTPTDREVTGASFSPEGDWFVWVSKTKGGTGRRIDTIDLKKKRPYRVSPPRSTVGETAIFLPRSHMLVFADGPYVVFSDPRGGDRTQQKVPGLSGTALAGFATSADGLELAVAVHPPAKRKAKDEGADPSWRKFSLTVLAE